MRQLKGYNKALENPDNENPDNANAQSDSGSRRAREGETDLITSCHSHKTLEFI